jgi:hypothetical protein
MFKLADEIIVRTRGRALQAANHEDVEEAGIGPLAPESRA